MSPVHPYFLISGDYQFEQQPAVQPTARMLTFASALFIQLAHVQKVDPRNFSAVSASYLEAASPQMRPTLPPRGKGIASCVVTITPDSSIPQDFPLFNINGFNHVTLATHMNIFE